MTQTLSQTELALRQVFKVGNRFMVLLFRLGLGGWGNSPRTSQVMVLVHRGRKSGLQRRTPVNYAVVEGDIYCTAAFGVAADWYQNIVAEPKVEVWLPGAWYAGMAEEVPPDDPRRDELMRQVLVASGFAAPLFAGMDPKTATDEELAELTATYRLMRIRRTGARTGPGGPGDLAWVWPVATFLSLGWLWLRPRRHGGLEGPEPVVQAARSRREH
jgi:deazaflavin-dependent oxidoreductase (nitroreductase family)